MISKCPTCGALHKSYHNDDDLDRLLISAYDRRAEPFSRDVVFSTNVAAWVAANSTMRPSSKSVGKRLCATPINGTSIRFRVGDGVYRAIVISSKPRWLSAPGKCLMAHIEGSDDIDDLLL